mmetsp:Transcript_38813/g.110739  ORF Transcript_38813/g.110739 Transcript_38813/m.110739 type:complete len:211 (-) Transcript_38813:3-635(-)
MRRISLADRSASPYHPMLRLILAVVSRTSAWPSFSLMSRKMATACLAVFRASCLLCVARWMPAIVLSVAASAALLPALVYIAMAFSASCMAAGSLPVRPCTLARVCSTEASALASVSLPSTCWALSAICRASKRSPAPKWIFATTCRAQNFDLTSFVWQAASKAPRAAFTACLIAPVAAKSRALFTHAGPSLEDSSKLSAMMKAVIARVL